MNESDSTTLESVEPIVRKLDELIEAITTKNTITSLNIEHVLWTNAEIAEYISVTYKYANEYIVTHHEFPDPVRLPNKIGKTGNPRWYAKEVIDWVSTYRRV